MKGLAFFIRQQVERKVFLFSELRVTNKGQMFLKYRNRQKLSAICPSMVMCNRKFPSITGFLLLLSLTKIWKTSHHIIALAVAILTRFVTVCNSSFLIIYPFPTTLFNSSWWSYPCILLLIFNKVGSFKFLSVGKKITSPWLTKYFAKTISWDTNDLRKDFFPAENCKESAMRRLLQALGFCRFDRGIRILLKEFSDRNDFEWEKYHLCDIYSFVVSLIITFKFHCTLYLIQNEWSKWPKNRNGNIKCRPWSSL